jgi:hypothetical protein
MAVLLLNHFIVQNAKNDLMFIIMERLSGLLFINREIDLALKLHMR